MTRLAPIASPAASAGWPCPEASIAVTASSGSAPASSTPEREHADPQPGRRAGDVLGEPSAPAVSSAAPATSRRSGTTISAPDQFPRGCRKLSLTMGNFPWERQFACIAGQRRAVRRGRTSPAARSRRAGRGARAAGRGRPSRRRARRPSRRCRCTGPGAGPGPGCRVAAARSSASTRSRELAATPPPIRRSSMPSAGGGVDRLAGEHVADRLLERRGHVGDRHRLAGRARGPRPSGRPRSSGRRRRSRSGAAPGRAAR